MDTELTPMGTEIGKAKDWADRIASDILPCWTTCQEETENMPKQHRYPCPAHYRPNVAKVLRRLYRDSEGVFRIAEERGRQLSVEGWSIEHDDEHTDGSLAVVAATLAVCGTDATVCDPLNRGTPNAHGDAEHHDAWGLITKHHKDELRCLVIAGALIAAEIDRIIRTKQH